MPAKKSTGRVTPKKSVAARRPTPAKDWKVKPGELQVPSGNVCLVKRPGIQDFIGSGVVPNSLMSLMMEAAAGKGVPDKTLQKNLVDITKDPKKMQDMLGMVDAVAIRVVVDPAMRSATFTTDDVLDELCTAEEVGRLIPYARRNPDVLYVDDVDTEDKMFIFQWAVGGDRDVDRFRGKQAELLGAVSDGQDVGEDT